MASYSLERTVNIPMNKVWAMIGDFTNSPGSDISVKVEKYGDLKSGGVGTIREITIGKACVREVLETVDPPQGFTYRILSGAPLKDYVGKVTLEDKGEDTIIRWSAELTPKIPFTGGICCKLAKRAANKLIDSVEKDNAKLRNGLTSA